MYCTVVLGLAAATLGGCSNADLSAAFDIGNPNDMASRQEQSRANRSIPTAAEMPPGLGEDLPAAPPAPQPMTSNQ
jgi:hypothetical protein